jgi:hypothetical protein
MTKLLTALAAAAGVLVAAAIGPAPIDLVNSAHAQAGGAKLPPGGVPKPPPPKGPITNGDRPGAKPDPEKGRKPGGPKPKGNGNKPKKQASASKSDKTKDCGGKKSSKC